MNEYEYTMNAMGLSDSEVKIVLQLLLEKLKLRIVAEQTPDYRAFDLRKVD